jgi:PDZ domain-containing protein
MTETDREPTAPPPGPPPSPTPSPPPLPPAPGPPRPSRWRTIVAVGLSVLGGLLVVAVVAGFLIHLPYVVISPGEATPLDSSVVMISGAPSYDSTNNVLFLTVRVSNEDPTVWRVVTAWLNSDEDVEKRSNVVGCASPEDNVTYNTLLMQQSQSDAKDVALTRLGYTVTADAPRVTVVQACAGAPAYGILEVGDQVLAVDDTPVATSTELVARVRAHTPGDTIDISVNRDGATQATKVVAGRISADGTKCKVIASGATAEAGTACIGSASQDFVTYHFPIDVTINTERVGGPSAGLAFALAIIDDLTPGKLTDNNRVAVTGTIATDGSVGIVGGVEQKAITARRNGVQLMLVPKEEVADARKGADGMKVVGVATVDEALAALERAGGAPVPPTTSTAARS